MDRSDLFKPFAEQRRLRLAGMVIALGLLRALALWTFADWLKIPHPDSGLSETVAAAVRSALISVFCTAAVFAAITSEWIDAHGLEARRKTTWLTARVFVLVAAWDLLLSASFILVLPGIWLAYRLAARADVLAWARGERFWGPRRIERLWRLLPLFLLMAIVDQATPPDPRASILLLIAWSCVDVLATAIIAALYLSGLPQAHSDERAQADPLRSLSIAGASLRVTAAVQTAAAAAAGLVFFANIGCTLVGGAAWPSPGRAGALDSLSLGLLNSVGQIAVMYGTLCLLGWTYAAQTVQSQVDAQRGVVPERTPAWAVAAFFVPFANIVVPYRVMRASIAGHLPAPPLTAALWWVLYVIAAKSPALFNLVSHEELAGLAALWIVVCGLRIASGLLTARCVRAGTTGLTLQSARAAEANGT